MFSVRYAKQIKIKAIVFYKIRTVVRIYITFNIPKLQTMKNSFLLSLILLSFISVFAQPFAVGTRTFTFNDPARTGGTGSGGGAGRQIESELYYPANAAGANATVATGKFPVVVFGHGFAMTANSYTQFYNKLAENGYIVVAPRTEGSTLPAPSHTDFGKDLAIVLGRALDFDTVAASPFFGKVLQKGAIAGHSMGGGCTFLSDQYNSRATCYLTMAPANTNPPSIDAGKAIAKPMCILSGTRDCVAGLAAHQQPMYDSMFVSPCKQLVSITDARHCSFSNGNSTTCNFGEGTSGCGSSPLTTANQIIIVTNIMLPYFNYFLKGICTEWDVYQTYITTTSSLTTRQSCNMPVPSFAAITGDSVFCGVGNTTLTATQTGFDYEWSNGSTSNVITVSAVGSYNVSVSNPYCSITSGTVNVSQQTLPTAPASISGLDTVCSAQTTTFTAATVAGATSYNWTVPNAWTPSSISGNTVTITTFANSATISVAAVNSCGTSSTTTKTVTVLETLDAPTAINGQTTFCEGESGTFTATAVAGAGSYTWTVPSGWSTSGSSGTSITINSINGSGTISVSANNSCGAGAAVSKTITVSPAPQPTISKSGNTLTTTPSGLTYQWYKDGSPIGSPTSNPSYTATANGTYYVEATDASSCTSRSADIVINVNSIENISGSNNIYEVWPNPTSDFITIKNTAAKDLWSLIDYTGRVVLKGNCNSSTTNIQFNGIAKGLYLLKINDESHRVVLK